MARSKKGLSDSGFKRRSDVRAFAKDAVKQRTPKTLHNSPHFKRVCAAVAQQVALLTVHQTLRVDDAKIELDQAYEMDPGQLDGEIRPLLKELRDRGLLEGKPAEEIARAAEERDAAVAKLRRIPVPKDT